MTAVCSYQKQDASHQHLTEGMFSQHLCPRGLNTRGQKRLSNMFLPLALASDEPVAQVQEDQRTQLRPTDSVFQVTSKLTIKYI